MEEPFVRFEKELSEMYEVARTAIVVAGRKHIRVEVLKDCRSERPRFKVWYSTLERSPELGHHVWADANFPSWVDTDNELGAFTQGLEFVAEGVRMSASA